jgi:hypothetical protein
MLSIELQLLKLLNKAGDIVPDMLLLLMEIYLRLDSDPKNGGKVPVRKLSLKYTSSRLESSRKNDGKVPRSALQDKSKYIRLTDEFNKFAGIVDVSALYCRLKY